MNTALNTKITPFSDERLPGLLEDIKALRPLLQKNAVVNGAVQR